MANRINKTKKIINLFFDLKDDDRSVQTIIKKLGAQGIRVDATAVLKAVGTLVFNRPGDLVDLLRPEQPAPEPPKPIVRIEDALLSEEVWFASTIKKMVDKFGIDNVRDMASVFA